MTQIERKSEKRFLILLGTIITQIGLGTIYTWSLFNQPIADKFGWKLSKVTVTFSIASFALAFATLFVGKIQDKIGIRKMISLAGIVMGLGLILTSKANSLTMLYITAGIVVGAADGIGYMASLSNCIKWFPDKKGLISGIAVGSYGAGSLIFKYINSDIINSRGVTVAFLSWGIIACLMVTGGAQLLRDAKVSAAASENKAKNYDYTPKEMLKKKEAYLLFIMMFTACMSGLYIIGIVKDIGVSMAGLSVSVAANAVAMVAIFNTAGRIILGALSDKVGRLKVIAFALSVTAVSVFVMNTVHMNFAIFFACVAGIAFSFGGNITVFPALVGEFFGLKNHSKNYGIIYQGFGIGALSGSVIANIAGSFKATFVVIGIMCVLSILIAIYIKVPQIESDKKSLKLRERTAM
ncbi:OFA family MFS transporter [Clostridium sp. 19966]|uniref:L-lactate MFS transporter n=1 Tax=Clostridium sp. 19966 TaxID=2768166 RepID=UPI0028DE8D97|nr:OFA family MFS transporter [Clostridium sp. 19966]MDT8718173.1 OFA family MFS transporter [Clostridium sp. 19966]